MRRAEADTCYVYSRSHSDETYYGFRRVDEVGEDWYTDETYIVDSDHIYYEDASWTGSIARRIDGDKIILKKDYNRLKDMVESARVSIVESLKKVAKERDRELQVGDYLLHYYVDHEEWCDSDNIQHVHHEVISTCYKILEISDDRYRVVNLLSIDKNYFRYKPHECELIEDYEKEWVENALLINEEQCSKAIAAALDVKEKVIEKIRKLL